MELAAPDRHCVNAATGWLELGNATEAEAELASASPASANHPSVLQLRWQIHAHHKDWEQALRVAGRLIEAAPQDSCGYVDRSFALHELKRTREAKDTLQAVLTRFPKEAIIPYNLACYACQLGDLGETWNWLRQTIAIQGKDKTQFMALKDPDLQPCWDEIRKL